MHKRLNERFDYKQRRKEIIDKALYNCRVCLYSENTRGATEQLLLAVEGLEEIIIGEGVKCVE